MKKPEEKEWGCCKRLGIFLIVILCVIGVLTAIDWSVNQVTFISESLSSVQEGKNNLEDAINTIQSLERRIQSLEDREDTTQDFLKGKKWDNYISSKDNPSQNHITWASGFIRTN